MNNKGLFCFLLLLAFASIQTGLLGRATEMETGMAGALAFEAEQLSTARAIMENGIDLGAKEGLRQGIALNLEPEEIKALVNARLVLLFEKMETQGFPGIKTEFEEKGKNISFLNENSAVSVARIAGREVEAEYCFTGGLMKDKTVRAKISGTKAAITMELPVGYTVKETAIG
ncbi:MAG: hypothetical protein WC634_03585 [archaeon]